MNPRPLAALDLPPGKNGSKRDGKWLATGDGESEKVGDGTGGDNPRENPPHRAGNHWDVLRMLDWIWNFHGSY